MKAVMLYRPDSEHARIMEEYSRDFERQHGKSIELLNIDTVEGSQTAKLYDITQYPTLLVLREDGQLQERWEGGELPLMNDVAYFLHV